MSTENIAAADVALGASSSGRSTIGNTGRAVAARAGLQSVVSTLRHRAENLPRAERITEFMELAADKFRSTARHGRHQIRSVSADAERWIKNNPGSSLVTAALTGFLVGRVLFTRR